MWPRRESLANFYLDVAEKLPALRGTGIATLHRIRKSQRAQEVVARKQAKQPEGSNISYPWVRLAELFPLEDYEELERRLRDLVPEDTFGRDLVSGFREFAMGLSPLGNVLVGHVSAKKLSLAAMPHGILDTLPAEVEMVTIRLHKILPSMFAVTFDVRLTVAVTEKLRALQAETCLPRVAFRQLVPWGSGAHSHSVTSAQAARQELVIEWLLDLRGRVEKSLLPRVRGYFASGHRGRPPCLPAFEIFSLSGVPRDDEPFKEWMNTGGAWLDALGASQMVINWYGFKEKDLLLVLPLEIKGTASAYRIFSLSGSADNWELEGHERSVLEDTLDNALPVLLLAAFLDRTQETVEELRKDVYKRLKEKSRYGRFRKDFRLNQRLQRTSLLVSRFELEVKQSTEWLNDYSRAIEEFRRVGGPSNLVGEKLSEVVRRGIKAQYHLIGSHQRLISELFSDHLSWRNLDENYRLQRRILWWTMVVSLATLAGLAATYWTALENLVHLFK
jgi:hypothetical protein